MRGFYPLHRLYLWVSTIQWVANMVLLTCWAGRDGAGVRKVGEEILKFSRQRECRKSRRNRFKPGNEQGRSKGCLGLFGLASGGFTGWSYHPAWWCFGMILADRARFGRSCLGFGLALSIVVLVGVQAGTDDRQPGAKTQPFWRPGVPVAVAVRDGQARFRVPVAGTGSDVLVVFRPWHRAPVPTPFSLTRPRPRTRVRALPIRPAPPARPPKPCALRSRTDRAASLGMPPLKRDFSLMVRDGDVASASNYLAVRGVLRAVGKRVQVYVAAEDVGQVEPELLKDLVATFDDRIVPVAAATVGLARDVDGDGRFTVLLSSWLNRLGNGRNAVDGFVRVSDLDLAYSAPFGNRCDMMYLSTSLKPGPHLRTVLTHEYMHAIVFSGKCEQATEVRGRSCSRKRVGWTRRSLTWPRTSRRFRGRTSTTASVHSCRSPNDTSSWSRTTMPPTCSAAMAIGEAPTCFCGGAWTSTVPS